MDQFKKAQKLADELKKQRTAELEKKRELALKKERLVPTWQWQRRMNYVKSPITVEAC